VNPLLALAALPAHRGREPRAAPTGTSALVFVAGFSMSVTPGKVGELLKSALLRDACRRARGRAPRRWSSPSGSPTWSALVVLGIGGVGRVRRGRAARARREHRGRARPLRGLVEAARAHGHSTRPRASARSARSRRACARCTTPWRSWSRPRRSGWGTALGVLAWLCECLGFAIIVRGFPGASVPGGFWRR